MMFKLSDIVVSRKIGMRESFTGEIVELTSKLICRSNATTQTDAVVHTYYQVLDAYGCLWHRDENDLRLADLKQCKCTAP